MKVARELPDLRVVPDDPNDDMVVATAMVTDAKPIVTGDRHKLSLGTFGGIRAASPRALLDLLEAWLRPPLALRPGSGDARAHGSAGRPCA